MTAKNPGNVLSQKKWRDKNRSRVRSIQIQKRQDKRKWFYDEVLSKSSCLECGESHPGCMDFHHRDPKTKSYNISDMIQKRFSNIKILAELVKCDVLCANCHRKLHWEELSYKHEYIGSIGSLL